MRHMIKKYLFTRILLCAAGFSMVCLAVPVSAEQAATPVTDLSKPPKNVIIMIADGMSVNGYTLARWFSGGKSFAMDEYLSGLVRTYPATAAITDSAPAATAMATGHKSHSKYISVLPEQNTMPNLPALSDNVHQRPVMTIMTAARLSGKATGLVATSEVMHATPAAFTAHAVNRSDYNTLTEQMAHNHLDVVLGGGYDYFLPQNRSDGENMIEALEKQSYQIIRDKNELLATEHHKVFGLFAAKDMAYEIDRQYTNEPSLADMTSQAIRLLSKNDQGFLLMVEGSKIDWSAHTNDPIGVMHDIIAFTQAVEVALDFAKQNGDTAVIATTDHGNGGLTIGLDRFDSLAYDTRPLASYLEPLQQVSMSAARVSQLMQENPAQARSILDTYYPLEKMTDEALSTLLLSPNSYDLPIALGQMLSRQAYLGWTSNGHTGEDVILMSYAPDHYPRLTGLIENTDIAHYVANAWSLPLDMLTQVNFKTPKELFQNTAYRFEEKQTFDKKNTYLLVTKAGSSQRFHIPQNKNYIEVNGQKRYLNKVMVHTGKEWFLPHSLLDALR